MNADGFSLWFPILTGSWGLVMVVIFVMAIRLSYRIEQRSPDLENRTGIPRKAMIFHTVTNWKVARDEETQAMRQKMNRLLLVNAAGFALMGLWVALRGD